MKYLDKSFSVYPTVRPASKITRTAEVKTIDPKHSYSDIGGMCRICALSREGHNTRFKK